MDTETVNLNAMYCAGRSASRHRTAESFSCAFGRVLRDQRVARGLSQEALAYAAGLDRKYTGRVERGESVPSLITMFKLAAALGIALSQLIERAEQAERARSSLIKDSGKTYSQARRQT